MKEYRIVTHFSTGNDTDEPWYAFLFESEFEGQTHCDYITSMCRLLNANGKFKTGDSEADAVMKLFKSVTREETEKTDTISIKYCPNCRINRIEEYDFCYNCGKNYAHR